MTTRISISLPDDLAGELKAHKDSMNISGVCAKALRKEVDLRKKVSEDTQSLRGTIARLRAQRLEHQEESQEADFLAGGAWAADDADYQEILWFAELREAGTSEDIGASVWGGMQELADTYQDSIRECEYDAALYWTGFMAGVLDVWDRIRAEVEAK